MNPADPQIRKTWISTRPRTTCETKLPGRRNPSPLPKCSTANPNSVPCAIRRISMRTLSEAPCPVRTPNRHLVMFRLNLQTIFCKENMKRTSWTSDLSASLAWLDTISEPSATIISPLHPSSNVKSPTGPTSNPTMILNRHTSKHPLTRHIRRRALTSTRMAMLLLRCRGRAVRAR